MKKPGLPGSRKPSNCKEKPHKSKKTCNTLYKLLHVFLPAYYIGTLGVYTTPFFIFFLKFCDFSYHDTSPFYKENRASCNSLYKVLHGTPRRAAGSGF